MFNKNLQKPEKMKFRFLAGSDLVELTDSKGNTRVIELEEPEDFITNILESRAKKIEGRKVIDKTSKSWWQRGTI